MSQEIVVPQVGEAVDEVLLVRWFKQEGEPVQKGEPLFEVDTDKVTMEVEAFADGVLARILVAEGSGVMPQQVVGILAAADEAQGVEPAQPAAANGKGSGRLTPVAQRMAAEMGIHADGLDGSGPGGRVTAGDLRRLVETQRPADAIPARVLASPRARRMAAEWNVDLRGLTGSGVDGLIRVRDVEAARQASAPSAMPAAVEDGQPVGAPLSRLRQAIAAATQASKQTVPHFYLMADVDMSQVQSLRAYCTETLGWAKAPTYTDVLVRACALALAALPDLNATLVGDRITPRPSVDIGVAVSVPGGLVTPSLAQADQLSLAQVSARLREQVERARGNRLRPEAMGGKSLVISNLGMYAVDSFIAIIEQPAPMILAVGRMSDRVVAVGGQPAVRPICTLTLSADHRILDGAPAAEFLTRVVRILEQPFAILGAERV